MTLLSILHIRNHSHNDFLEPENEMTTCPISIFIVDMAIFKERGVFDSVITQYFLPWY